MRTLGTPTQLRLKFDQGYKFMLAVDDRAHEEPATAFVKQLLPGAAVRDSINGVVTYDVPKASVVMSQLFAQMEAEKARLHITDWGLSHTTLEEVFLKSALAGRSNAAQSLQPRHTCTCNTCSRVRVPLALDTPVVADSVPAGAVPPTEKTKLGSGIELSTPSSMVA